jgi:hypothetical protein
MHIFKNYAEWRAAITGPCGLTLDRGYCEQRIAALRDDEAPGTRPFLDSYGSEYRDQVIGWFEQALSEA